MAPKHRVMLQNYLRKLLEVGAKKSSCVLETATGAAGGCIEAGLGDEGFLTTISFPKFWTAGGAW